MSIHPEHNSDKIDKDTQEYYLASERFFPSSVQEERRYNQLLEPFGVSYQIYNVLGLLLQYPEGMEPSKIADELCTLRQTMTNIVDGLQKSGYVERFPHPNDRRRILIKLLPQGEVFIVRMKQETMAFHRTVMTRFTKEEMKTYFAIRDRITHFMDEELQSVLAKRTE